MMDTRASYPNTISPRPSRSRNHGTKGAEGLCLTAHRSPTNEESRQREGTSQGTHPFSIQHLLLYEYYFKAYPIVHNSSQTETLAPRTDNAHPHPNPNPYPIPISISTSNPPFPFPIKNGNLCLARSHSKVPYRFRSRNQETCSWYSLLLASLLVSAICRGAWHIATWHIKNRMA